MYTLIGEDLRGCTYFFCKLWIKFIECQICEMNVKKFKINGCFIKIVQTSGMMRYSLVEMQQR